MYNMVLDGFYFSYSLCEINDKSAACSSNLSKQKID